MPEDSVFISRASGLEVNRLTPRETVRMIRAMVEWLSKNELRPASVMAVAGIDAGTLRGRFTESGFAGSVVAKTGTLHTTDSALRLAGVILHPQTRPSSLPFMTAPKIRMFRSCDAPG
ncbi:MAG: D-alanyl-D-alanine carboxypeptidase [Acidobacteria bacterium]|nr:D-alanyl-D-alanine carboxypeptidase [Acidobacteriota bacterium]